MSFKYHQVPTGAVNGINKIFTAPDIFITGTARFFLRGLEQFNPNDFTETSVNQITTTDAPQTGDDIWMHYEIT